MQGANAGYKYAKENPDQVKKGVDWAKENPDAAKKVLRFFHGVLTWLVLAGGVIVNTEEIRNKQSTKSETRSHPVVLGLQCGVHVCCQQREPRRPQDYEQSGVPVRKGQPRRRMP
jgi:hypothetical protein